MRQEATIEQHVVRGRVQRAKRRVLVQPNEVIRVRRDHEAITRGVVLGSDFGEGAHIVIVELEVHWGWHRAMCRQVH